jgi:hypothetical protein
MADDKKAIVRPTYAIDLIHSWESAGISQRLSDFRPIGNLAL